MIKSIHIHNIKILKDVEQSLAPLTILTGLNGRGKSTFIQSLLLAWNTLKNNDVCFNFDNEYIYLESVGSAFSWDHDDEVIALELEIDDCKFSFVSEPIDYGNIEEDILPLDLTNNITFPRATLPYRLQYLSAWRMGSMKTFPMASRAVLLNNSVSVKYGDGMATPRFLHMHKNKQIPVSNLSYQPDVSLELGEQVNAWLKDISPDLNLQPEKGAKEMFLRYSPAGFRGVSTLRADACNVGYGITYALPVVTAVLASRPGDIVVVETPEAHIHPAGQAKLMNLISLAVSNGIQVILETHSDHIIHGVLRNLKNGVLKPEEVGVMFFDKSADSTVMPISLKCTENGRIRGACRGFFDQYMIDMDELL